MVEEGLAAAIGAGVPVDDPHASAVVDIGGGTTNIAAIVNGSIIASRAERVGSSDIDAAISRGINSGADGYAVATGFMVAAERRTVAAALLRAKAPAIASSAVLADAGVLMSYGPSQAQLFRQAAGYVDKILNGASPAAMPIEQPTKFELVVNVKAAAAIGAQFPGSLLLRADRVIE